MRERYIDVRRAVDYLESLLGVQWLKENLKQMKGSAGGGVGFGRPVEQDAGAVPVIAYYWYRAREELVLQSISGQGTGLFALQAAATGDDLMVLQGSWGLGSRLEGLKQVLGAPVVLAELAIASGYARSGGRVTFSDTPGKFRVAGMDMIMHVKTRPAPQPPDGQMETRAFCNTGNSDPGNRSENKVFYWWTGYLGQRHRDSLVSPGGDSIACQVVVTIEAGQKNGGPVLTRRGRLLSAPRGDCGQVYVPREKIMPVRC